MPRSVRIFERTWLCAWLIGIVVATIVHPGMVSAASGIFGDLARLFVVFFQIFTLGFTLLFVLLASRKRNRIAMRTLIAFFGVGLVFYIPQLFVISEAGMLGVLSSVQLLMQCVGVYFLLTEESRDWFNGTDLYPAN